MIFDYSLAALVAAGLLLYLIVALLRPERFKLALVFEVIEEAILGDSDRGNQLLD